MDLPRHAGLQITLQGIGFGRRQPGLAVLDVGIGEVVGKQHGGTVAPGGFAVAAAIAGK